MFWQAWSGRRWRFANPNSYIFPAIHRALLICAGHKLVCRLCCVNLDDSRTPWLAAAAALNASIDARPLRNESTLAELINNAPEILSPLVGYHGEKADSQSMLAL
jgi:hypothetical protein